MFHIAALKFMTMNKLLIVALMSVFSVLTSYAETDNSKTQRVVILDKAPKKNDHKNRAPELIPLECYYNGFAGQVEIILDAGSGETLVRLSNLVTGEAATMTESTSLIIVPVPSDGLYMLEITLSNGREYYGTFSTEE